MRCAEVLEFRGAVNVQCRIVELRPSSSRSTPGSSGGIQLTVAAGADFAEWTIRVARGEAMRPRFGEFADGLRMSSHESSLFLTEADAQVLGRRGRVLAGEDR